MPAANPSLVRWTRWVRAALLAAAVHVTASSAFAAPKSHVVHSGQRLGSIAKRYNVSIDELCAANGIRRTDKIFPGQQLLIPEAGKPGQKSAAATKSSPRGAVATPQKKASPAGPKKKAAAHGYPLIHVVVQGQTLGAIGKRYGVTLDAICHASGITRRGVLKIGQQLLVPAATDPDGEYARSLRIAGRLDNPGGPSSWQKYSKAPWRRGYVTIQGYSRQFKGYVFGPGQKVLPKAKAEISSLLGVRAGGPRIDDQLIRLMAQVSDQFGGRPLRVVSGYRETSFVHDSKHKVGRALDFSVPGVPNEAVRDYCRTLGGVGVGYYPNSTFVHLDVRPHPAYWVDYAGPGEPPRLTPHAPRRSAQATAQLTQKKPTEASDGAPREGSEAPPHSHSAAEPAQADPEAPPAAELTPPDPAAPTSGG